MEINKIYCMDCLKGMKQLKDNSIDLVVTDPPYQLCSTKKQGFDSGSISDDGVWARHGKFQEQAKSGFMGKEWDVLPKQEIWNEMFRVLKEGAFAFIMMTPRQDSLWRSIKMLEKSGFQISFTPIFWAYASGFPKASNISKMVDKRRGTTPNQSREFAEHIKKRREELKLGLTEVDNFVCNGSTNYSWFEGRPAGQRLPRLEEYRKIKEILKLNDIWDEFIGEAEREVIAKTDLTFGYQKNGDRWNKGYDITTPTTDQAKALNGSFGGFQPKPAVEVILVAMKPLSEKTYVEQALKNKKGINWLDDCRIPYESDKELEKRKRGFCSADSMAMANAGEVGFKPYNLDEYINQQGRFPANLLVSDNVLDDGRIMKYSVTKGMSTGKSKFFANDTHQEHKTGYEDTGQFSRYFSLDKWAEQKFNIKKLPKSIQKTFPFMIVPKPSKSEKNEGLDGFENGYKTEQNKWIENDYRKANGEKTALKTKNIHPTTKPLKLMSYLITLGSREGDLILDPFIGSGTTAIACRLLSRNFIGFEIEEEYHKIAEARIKQYLEQTKLSEIIT